MMNKLSLTVANKRKEMNTGVATFREEQEQFRKRNAGKQVLVRRVDEKGNVLSETEEMIVPLEEAVTEMKTDT